MKKIVTVTLAGAFTWGLGMHAAMAADMKMNAGSTVDQNPMQQAGTRSAPTPGWEKLSKSKNWKPAASGTGQAQGDHMKADSKVVPAGQGQGPEPGR